MWFAELCLYIIQILLVLVFFVLFCFAANVLFQRTRGYVSQEVSWPLCVQIKSMCPIAGICTKDGKAGLDCYPFCSDIHFFLS